MPRTVRRIGAEETIDLRWVILRPGFPRETAIFAGDELTSTRHYGAFSDGKLVGVASIYRVDFPDSREAENAWQLRGMATLEEVRGKGFGELLLEASVNGAREVGGALLWCNARVGAAAFYARFGWERVGEEFDIPTVGPHYRMRRRLPLI